MTEYVKFKVEGWPTEMAKKPQKGEIQRFLRPSAIFRPTDPIEAQKSEMVSKYKTIEQLVDEALERAGLGWSADNNGLDLNNISEYRDDVGDEYIKVQIGDRVFYAEHDPNLRVSVFQEKGRPPRKSEWEDLKDIIRENDYDAVVDIDHYISRCTRSVPTEFRSVIEGAICQRVSEMVKRSEDIEKQSEKFSMERF